MDFTPESCGGRVDLVARSKLLGRRIMARQGNTVKIIFAFLFCLLIAGTVYVALDGISQVFLPEELIGTALIMTFVFSTTVYSMANVWLLRFGMRLGRGKAEFFELGEGCGFAASAAMGFGTLLVFSVILVFYAYVKCWAPYVREILGLAVYGLCMVLASALSGIIVLWIFTGFFFLPAIADRRKMTFWELVFASFKAASGKRSEIIKFVSGFSILTVLSLLSLGILFFVYVIPLYITSYGVFCSEVLD